MVEQGRVSPKNPSESSTKRNRLQYGVDALYIAMCRTAYDIQRVWKPKGGDLYYRESKKRKWAHRNGVFLLSSIRETQRHVYKYTRYDGSEVVYSRGWKESSENVTRIWLPSQEQLQDMLDFRFCFAGDDTGLLGMSRYFYSFVEKNRGSKYFSTLRHFWLAFVMSVKYHKVWDGEDWIGSSVPKVSME